MSRRSARRSSPRWPSRSAVSCVADVAVIGASGFTGALAARLVHRHPDLELVAVTSRSDAGRRPDDPYPQYRVPPLLDAFDLDEPGPPDAPIVAHPHGAAARTAPPPHRRRG